ncbi:MAG: patatin-like phospholipase family protein [Candidatus Symbiothrix sp.]|jgi:NTE family protein|nr:patatin-like phospholipase family protein [Candidatus Symbiothrix sp.]
MKRAFVFYLLSTGCFLLLSAQQVGLVLSGGGAKGAIHIGVIKALEENEIPIDYIAGTSIGAIVGSLYAMGYTPEDMLNLLLSEDFYYWQTGKVEEYYQYYFRKAPEDPAFVRFNIPLRDSIVDLQKSLLPNSLINPIQMNQAFMQLYAASTAQCRGNFDSLMVPFLCVSSDVYNKRPIIFRDGDLGDAVRSSMSFPLFFKPILKDNIPLWDGGIYDNFPVRPMQQAWQPDVIIGSQVAGIDTTPPDKQNLYGQLERIVMQSTNYGLNEADGILLNFAPTNVNLLDFDKAQMLYDVGYQTTMQRIDEIKSRVSRRVPQTAVAERRQAYKAALPDLRFRNIYISGVTDAQKAYIESQIHHGKNQYFTIEDFKQTYFRILTNSKIKEILPHAQYDPENKVFDLYLDIKIENEIGISFGGNISSMSANQVYFGLNYQTLQPVAAQYNFSMQLGNAYNNVIFAGDWELHKAKKPMSLSLLLVYSAQKYFEQKKLFINNDLSALINKKENFARLGLGFPTNNNSKIDITAAYGYLEDLYFERNDLIEYDKSKYSLGNLGAIYQKYTLDARQFPISGKNYQLAVNYVFGNENYQPAQSENRLSKKPKQSYFQTYIKWNNYMELSRKFNLGYLIEGVMSNKKMWSNYTASILQAPGFSPTPHSQLVFNEAFHANQYAAGGVIPIWKLNNTFHLRGDFYGFMPLRPILRDNNAAIYGNYLENPAYMGEISLVAQLSFMSVSLYANYYSYPRNNWNFGLNIGYLIFGTKFIK